jgi:hypothetical protein
MAASLVQWAGSDLFHPQHQKPGDDGPDFRPVRPTQVKAAHQQLDAFAGEPDGSFGDPVDAGVCAAGDDH